MDSWTENAWMARFRELVAGRTALMITHRFTTAMQADIIHVMVAGQIVESGTHAELLAYNGRYAQSWRQQMHQAQVSEGIAPFQPDKTKVPPEESRRASTPRRRQKHLEGEKEQKVDEDKDARQEQEDKDTKQKQVGKALKRSEDHAMQFNYGKFTVTIEEHTSISDKGRTRARRHDAIPWPV